MKKGGGREKVSKPELILSYNKCMGVVDLLDAAMHHYNCARKSNYWFLKYAIYIFQTMHLNAFVMYKKSWQHGIFTIFGKKIRVFILSTGEGRHPTTVSGVSRGRPSYEKDLSWRSTNHMPSRIPTIANRKRPARRCRLCSHSGKRKETVFYCNDCPRQPA